MTALTLATVSDFAVLRPDPVTELRLAGTSAPARRRPITAASWTGSGGPRTPPACHHADTC